MMMIMVTTFNIRLFACAMVKTFGPPVEKTIKESISLPPGDDIPFDSGQISRSIARLFSPKINRTPLTFDCSPLDHTHFQRICLGGKKHKVNDRGLQNDQNSYRERSCVVSLTWWLIYDSESWRKKDLFIPVVDGIRMSESNSPWALGKDEKANMLSFEGWIIFFKEWRTKIFFSIYYIIIYYIINIQYIIVNTFNYKIINIIV